MCFSLKYRVETNKGDDEVFDLLQLNKELIEQEIKRSFFLKLACFRVKLNKKKKQLKICRLNPFWDFTILEIMPAEEGCIVEIRSCPQPFYDYIFLVLLAVLFLMLAFSLDGILFTILVWCGFFLISVINLKTKYSSFRILKEFCQRNIHKEE